jgi:hypothetical protein
MADGGLNLIISILKRLGRRINEVPEDGAYQPSSLTKDVLQVLPSIHGSQSQSSSQSSSSSSTSTQQQQQQQSPDHISLTPDSSSTSEQQDHQNQNQTSNSAGYFDKKLTSFESTVSLANMSASSLSSSFNDLTALTQAALSAAVPTSSEVSSSSTSTTSSSSSSSQPSQSSSSSSSTSPSSTVKLTPENLALLESRINQRLAHRHSKSDSLDRFTFSNALSALTNIATRGRQKAKEALVESGIVPVLVELLEESVSLIEILQELQSSYSSTSQSSQPHAQQSQQQHSLQTQLSEASVAQGILDQPSVGGLLAGVASLAPAEGPQLLDLGRMDMDGPSGAPEDPLANSTDSLHSISNGGAAPSVTAALAEPPHVSAAAEPMARGRNARTIATPTVFGGLRPAPPGRVESASDMLEQTLDLLSDSDRPTTNPTRNNRNIRPGGAGDEEDAGVADSHPIMLRLEPSEPPRAVYNFSATANEPSLSDLIRENAGEANAGRAGAGGMIGVENTVVGRRRGSIDVGTGGNGVRVPNNVMGVGVGGIPAMNGVGVAVTPTALPNPLTTPMMNAVGVAAQVNLPPTTIPPPAANAALPTIPTFPTMGPVNGVGVAAAMPMYTYPVQAHHDIPMLPGVRYLPRTSLETSLMAEVLSRGLDILFAAKIIASLSKYHSMRTALHADSTRPQRPPKSSVTPTKKTSSKEKERDNPTVIMMETDNMEPHHKHQHHHPHMHDHPDEEDEEDFYEEPLNPRSAFELIEFFTGSSSLLPETRMWAVIALRNAYRRDPSSPVSFGPDGEVVSVSAGQLRRCAYARCGKWEERFKQFSKCSRCRRVTYCW